MTGGIDLAAEWAGFRTVGQCEFADYPTKVLEKHWPDTPRWRDIRNLSGWDLGLCEGVCYNKLCEANYNELRIWKTLNAPMRQKRLVEYIKSARIAGKKCPYLQAWLKKVGDFVPENVSTILCEAVAEQTQTAANGCAEQVTLIGMEALDVQMDKDRGNWLGNGVEGLSQEIRADVNIAESCQQKEKSEHTISNHGASIQNCVMNYLMGLLFAGDVTINCTRKKGVLNVLSGGIPCQPFSVAGKQKGKKDERYLWPEMCRIVRESNPNYVICENVPGILRIAADDVCKDLEREGYDVGIFDYEAAAVGAPHRRERIFFVGNAKHNGQSAQQELRGDETSSDKRGQKEQATPGEFARADRPVDVSGLYGSTDGSERFMAYTDAERELQQERFFRALREWPCNGSEIMADTESQQDRRLCQPGLQPDIGASSNVAHANEQGLQGRFGAIMPERAGERIAGEGGTYVADNDGERQQTGVFAGNQGKQIAEAQHDSSPLTGNGDGGIGTWWSTESGLGGVLDGFPQWLDGTVMWPALAGEEQYPWEAPRTATGINNRVDRLKCLGNAVVPKQVYPILAAIAEAFFQTNR